MNFSRSAALALLMFTMVSGTVAAKELAGDSLCVAWEERILASCPTANGKTISLCASHDLGEGTGTLQYRFGKSGKSELSFPKQPSHPSGWLRSLPSLSSGGTTVTYASFGSGAFTYTLFRYGDDSKGGESGVLVSGGSKPVARILCRPGESLDLSELSDIKDIPQIRPEAFKAPWFHEQQ
jgi:hypothetical protein